MALMGIEPKCHRLKAATGAAFGGLVRQCDFEAVVGSERVHTGGRLGTKTSTQPNSGPRNGGRDFRVGRKTCGNKGGFWDARSRGTQNIKPARRSWPDISGRGMHRRAGR